MESLDESGNTLDGGEYSMRMGSRKKSTADSRNGSIGMNKKLKSIANKMAGFVKIKKGKNNRPPTADSVAAGINDSINSINSQFNSPKKKKMKGFAESFKFKY